MMQENGTPAWMNVPPANNYAPPAGYKPPGAYAVESGSTHTCAKFGIRVVVIASAVLLGANGVIAFLNMGGSDNLVSDGFVSTYIVMLAALLFFHELSQIYPSQYVDNIVKRNFGFMYKPLGTGTFMIFVAFLNFGITQESRLSNATGISVSIVGFLYMLAYMRWPEFFELKEAQPSYAPPSPGVV
jgi:hypothetical protein